MGYAAAESLQSCPTLCDPVDGSPPGSPIPGILQARILEWVAISFSNAWKWKVKVKLLSCVRLLATSWTAAYKAPPSMGFFRQEYWSGVLNWMLVIVYSKVGPHLGRRKLTIYKDEQEILFLLLQNASSIPYGQPQIHKVQKWNCKNTVLVQKPTYF